MDFLSLMVDSDLVSHALIMRSIIRVIDFKSRLSEDLHYLLLTRRLAPSLS